jgi:hypothetical protein
MRFSILVMSLLILGWPFAASAVEADSGQTCADFKIRAAGNYSACLARAEIQGPGDEEGRAASCEAQLIRRFTRAERLDACPIEGNANEISGFLADVQTLVSEAVYDGTALPEVIEPACDPASENLADYEVWRREEGYWIGEYTFLGADGAPYESSGWNYPYDQYMGFIHLEIDGPKLSQRNVFLYRPQDAEKCTGELDEEGRPMDVVGDGTCGVHGNEKVFSADQMASDCQGGLAGPFVQGPFTLHTQTEIIGDDSVLYQVRLHEGGPLMQNQLTTLPGDGTRVRTAQGFVPFLPPGVPTWAYASYYRERKVSRDEFYATLEAVRAEYGIRVEDQCGFDNTNAPSGVTCEEHFGESVTP